MNFKPTTTSVLRLCLFGMIAMASAMLLRFTFSGPSQGFASMHSPVNAEGFIALGFIFLVVSASPLLSNENEATLSQFLSSKTIPVLLVAGVATLSFCRAVNIPLLYDAYTDVFLAAHETLRDVLGTFYEHPTGGDFFFRPVGNLTYYLDFAWAGFAPLPWHLWNLAVHVIISLLVYVFMHQISGERFAAMTASLIFAVHGTRPEVVSWVGERFDLLSALFVLLSLICFNIYLDSEKRRWYVLMVACCVLGLLSKEAAFCQPLLVLGLLAFKAPAQRRKIIQTAIVMLATCMLVFYYRWWVLRGIGGYKIPSGEATIYRFNAIHTLNALFFREWALYFFPINWSSDLELWAKFAIPLFLCVLGGALAWCRTRRTYLLGSLFFAIAASLPVQHLLLISKNLNGSRVLYLPVLGIAMFWGFLIQGCENRAVMLWLTAGLLVAESAFLQHNLSIWREAAFLSQRTCRSLGEKLSETDRSAVVIDLPSTWHGIYFLKNGFAACVAMNSNVSIDRVAVQTKRDANPENTAIFFWDGITESLHQK